IEYRQDVIDVAQNFFGVPDNDPRLTILQGDGYQLVSEICYRGEQQFDLLLVDAYDHEGMAQSIGAQIFFDACTGVLSAEGVMSINLWGSDRPSFNLTMQRINQSFNDQSLILPVADKGNVIGLALKQVVNPSQLKKLRSLAEQLEDKLQTSLPQSLQQLIRQNQSFLTRLFL
ncbi:MAG TPA: spermidine synthase, partial [Methylophaga sp.]|nr:spermidine synthase [Methylophaga sp.]